MTTWRQLHDCSNYIVSDDGRVRLASSGSDRTLYTGSNGYLYVNYYNDDGRWVNRTVHGLVAAAFFGKRHGNTQIRHLDGNRSNNSIDNLRYGTALENAADRVRHGRNCPGEKNGNSVISDQDVSLIRSQYRAGGITQYQLAKNFGISQAQINNILLNKQRIATDI